MYFGRKRKCSRHHFPLSLSDMSDTKEDEESEVHSFKSSEKQKSRLNFEMKTIPNILDWSFVNDHHHLFTKFYKSLSSCISECAESAYNVLCDLVQMTKSSVLAYF